MPISRECFIWRIIRRRMLRCGSLYPTVRRRRRDGKWGSDKQAGGTLGTAEQTALPEEAGGVEQTIPTEVSGT